MIMIWILCRRAKPTSIFNQFVYMICYCFKPIRIQNLRFYPIRAQGPFLINRSGHPCIPDFTFVSALLPQFRIIIKCKIILRVKTILYDHGGRTGERRATWDNIRYLIVHGHAAKHRIIMADNGGNMLITSSITFLEFYNLSWYLQFRRVRQIIEWKPKNLEDYFVSICKMAIKVKHSFHNQQSTKLSITLTRSVLSPINSRCIKAFLEAMEIGSIYCG